MQTFSVTKARVALDKLIEQVAASHEPILIAGEHNNAVLVSEDDWRALHETIYLLGIPGMRESIIEGLNAPADEFDDKIAG